MMRRLFGQEGFHVAVDHKDFVIILYSFLQQQPKYLIYQARKPTKKIVFTMFRYHSKKEFRFSMSKSEMEH